MREKILISACLLGLPVRYDGRGKLCHNRFITRWQRARRLLPFCPELAGGFVTPRPPAEIADGKTGADVLNGTACVLTKDGADVTAGYMAGAAAALRFARAHGCRYALLTERSPSCGAGRIYDGSFSGHLHAGDGVTTALFRRHGIQVFTQNEISALAQRIG